MNHQISVEIAKDFWFLIALPSSFVYSPFYIGITTIVKQLLLVVYCMTLIVDCIPQNRNRLLSGIHMGNVPHITYLVLPMRIYAGTMGQVMRLSNYSSVESIPHRSRVYSLLVAVLRGNQKLSCRVF